MNKSAVVLLITFFSMSVFAEGMSYKLPITREGVTTTRLAYNFWSGEYPSPMLKIGGNKKGKTKISAYKSLRKLNEPVKCTVKNGVYHPWGRTENSVINYYTVMALDEYQAIQDGYLVWADVGDEEAKPFMKAGDVLNVVYGSENYCVADVGATTIGFDCDAIGEDPNLKKVSPEDSFMEEWYYLQCAEGYNAFVEAESLRNQKGVSDAELVEYGYVK